MKTILYFSIIILIVGCKQQEQEKSVGEVQTQIKEVKKVKDTILKNFAYEDVARYAMASVMQQPSNIIKATKNNGLYYVSYIRKSDKQTFEYKVKFNDKKIIWGDIGGRWRDSKYDDELISFAENDNKLNIILTYSDGSEDIQEYKKGE